MKQTLLNRIMDDLSDVQFITSTPDNEYFTAEEDGGDIIINIDQIDHKVYVYFNGVIFQNVTMIHITNDVSHIIDSNGATLAVIDSVNKIISLEYDEARSDATNTFLSLETFDIPDYIKEYQMGNGIDVITERSKFPKFYFHIDSGDPNYDYISGDLLMRSDIEDINPIRVVRYEQESDISVLMSKMYLDMKTIEEFQKGDFNFSHLRYIIARRPDNTSAIFSAVKTKDYIILQDVETGFKTRLNYIDVIANDDNIRCIPEGVILLKSSTCIKGDLDASAMILMVTDCYPIVFHNTKKFKRTLLDLCKYITQNPDIFIDPEFSDPDKPIIVEKDAAANIEYLFNNEIGLNNPDNLFDAIYFVLDDIIINIPALISTAYPKLSISDSNDDDIDDLINNAVEEVEKELGE